MEFDHPAAAVEAMAAPSGAGPSPDLTPFDLAHDLFGYPPKEPVVCPACGDEAEPFRGETCWHCFHAHRAMSARWRELAREVG